MEMRTLTTQRLRLEPLVNAHIEPLYAVAQDHEIYRWIEREPPKSLASFAAAMRFLEKRISKDQTEYWLNWISIEQASNQIVGRIEISLHRKNLRAFVAYTTYKPHQQRGFGKEGCRVVIDHILREWNARTVFIEMDVENTSSMRLAESLGAKRVRYERKADFFKGAWHAQYRYEINSIHQIR